MEIPIAVAGRMLINAGAQRCSDAGKKALCEALEDIAYELAIDSINYAKHAGRKTVKAEDVKLALKNY